MEVQAADAVENGGFAPQEFRIPAHDDVVVIGLDGSVDVNNGLRSILTNSFAREGLCSGDDNDHNVTILADAANDYGAGHHYACLRCRRGY